MNVDILTRPPAASDLVRFHYQGPFKDPHVSASEFEGRKNSRVLLRQGPQRILHVGLGKEEQVKPDVLRQAAGAAVKALLRIGAVEISFDIEKWSAFVQPIVEGALLGGYKFEDYRAPEARRKNILRGVHLISKRSSPEMKKSLRLGRVLADATNFVRTIGNQPGNVMTPVVLAARAKSLATRYKLKCEIWDEKELRREGFGGITAVGQGSANPPRLIVMQMKAGPKSSPPIAVIGKAITFDSGGLSIKPADRMDEMKFDKMGGCAVLGIMQAAAELRLPVNLVGVIASAENMPSAEAYRPGDLIETWDGKVIEVLNTDAEGRVVLADALAYTRDTFRPRLMIDLATLTGACVVALGGQRAGLFTELEGVRNRLWELGAETGDRLWPLPMADEYADQIKSEIGLVKNTGGREGGACTAASFLRHWAGDIPWVHLDIAGPGWITKELPHLETGATGFGVRLLTEYVCELASGRAEPHLNGKPHRLKKK